MKMQELRSIAKKHGINSFGKSKANLIREIQIAEGNFDCFGNAVEYCDQWGCTYRPLCFDEANKYAARPEKKKAGGPGKKPAKVKRKTTRKKK
jgi:hypothetical protein